MKYIFVPQQLMIYQGTVARYIFCLKFSNFRAEVSGFQGIYFIILSKIFHLATVPSSILPLMSQLGYPSSLEELTTRFKKFINNDGYGVAVASLNNEIVGVIAWSKSMLFVSDKIRIHVEALVIDENYRGQKVGKRLMEYLEEKAKKHNQVLVDLTSGYRRAKDGTHAFYENLGYKSGESAGAYFRKEL